MIDNSLRHMHRFYAPALDPGDDMVALPRTEAEHLARVLRIGVGETVSVFDGRGREFLARVMIATPREVRVALVSPASPCVEPSVRVTLAQAVLKGDKMDDVIRDAVMLGVAVIQPLVTKRTEVTVAALLRGARMERWHRIALASVKQSRRAVLPEIQRPLTLETYVDEPSPAMRLMLVEPGAHADVEPLAVLRREPVPSQAAVWIGPEGGWEERECIAGREHGARLISLGPRTLRADAVPVAVMSVLAFLWEA